MRKALIPWVIGGTLCFGFGHAAEAKAHPGPPIVTIEKDGRKEWPMGDRTQRLLRQYLAWRALQDLI